MRILIAVIFSAAIWVAAAPLSANQDCAALWTQATPICKVLADAATYDGKIVTTKALYRGAIHGSVLYGRDCSETYVNLRGSADWKRDKQALATMRKLFGKHQSQPVEVVSRGTFRVAQQGHCFGPNCLEYEIEEHELLCARAAQPGSK